MNKSHILIASVVLVVIVAAAAWFVFLRPHAPRSEPQGGYRNGGITGSIEVLNDDGFTLTLADATTKDVNLSATTTIQDYTDASSTPSTITADQLAVGEQVSVIGAPNADGSIDAREVRVGNFPTMMMGRGGPRSATSTRPSGPPAQ